MGKKKLFMLVYIMKVTGVGENNTFESYFNFGACIGKQHESAQTFVCFYLSHFIFLELLMGSQSVWILPT